VARARRGRRGGRGRSRRATVQQKREAGAEAGQQAVHNSCGFTSVTDGPAQWCNIRGCKQRADSSDLDRKMLRTPLSQCQKDVLLNFLASGSNKQNFLSFSALRTIMAVSASLWPFFMCVRNMAPSRNLSL